MEGDSAHKNKIFKNVRTYLIKKKNSQKLFFFFKSVQIDMKYPESKEIYTFLAVYTMVQWIEFFFKLIMNPTEKNIFVSGSYTATQNSVVVYNGPPNSCKPRWIYWLFGLLFYRL